MRLPASQVELSNQCSATNFPPHLTDCRFFAFDQQITLRKSVFFPPIFWRFGCLDSSAAAVGALVAVLCTVK